LFPPSLEDFVPADDPVRFIRSFVDSLDIKGLGFKIRDANDGRPGYAASLLLKIWLFGSYERIVSSRKLQRQCRRDMALMWLCGMTAPDHNTLWRFFSDNKAAIKRLFKQSVQVALRNDLVGMVLHAIDGTKIGANASRFKSADKEEMQALLARLEEYVESMALQVEEYADLEPDDRLPAALQDAKVLQKRVQENVATLMKKDNGALSLTDMDSRKMKTNRGTVEFSYNAQVGVDGKHGIIVGAEVSREETDNHLLTSMRGEIAETSGGTAASTVADAGYFSGEEIAKAEVAGNVYVNIPVEHNRNAEKGVVHPYHLNNFTYDERRDVFVCPQGQTLQRRSRQGEYLEYVCTHFARCTHASACTQSKRRKTLTVHRHHKEIRQHKKRIAEASVQSLLRQRGSIVERVFGWIKEQYGLRRLTYRGLDNARALWYLACTVYNLRKIFACTNGRTHRYA